MSNGLAPSDISRLLRASSPAVTAQEMLKLRRRQPRKPTMPEKAPGPFCVTLPHQTRELRTIQKVDQRRISGNTEPQSIHPEIIQLSATFCLSLVRRAKKLVRAVHIRTKLTSKPSPFAEVGGNFALPSLENPHHENAVLAQRSCAREQDQRESNLPAQSPRKRQSPTQKRTGEWDHALGDPVEA